MPLLEYVSDDDLVKAIRNVYQAIDIGLEKIENNLYRNGIDPFSAIFEITRFHHGHFEHWLNQEKSRQAQKALVQAVGSFHQEILGAVEGWHNLGVGDNSNGDLVCTKLKVFAEIKNKHNTVKGSDLIHSYHSLKRQIEDKLSPYKGYKAYFVNIIPKNGNSYDVPFTPSDKETGKPATTDENIRLIDGASFYEFVTGNKNALQKLYSVLPKAIFMATGLQIAEKEQENLNELIHLAYKS